MFKRKLKEDILFEVKNDSFRYFKPKLRLGLNLEANRI